MVTNADPCNETDGLYGNWILIYYFVSLYVLLASSLVPARSTFRGGRPIVLGMIMFPLARHSEKVGR